MTEHRENREFVRSLERGLSVMTCFGVKHPRQRISEIARRTRMARATVRRILLTLESLGYVANVDGLYELTPRVLEIGYAYVSGQPIVEAAESVLERLVRSVDESSSVGVLDGDDVVYVARIQTRKIMSVNLSIGSRLPALWTSMGRVLIASLPREERTGYVDRRRNVRYTSKTKIESSLLLEVLEEVGREGWALIEEELEYGLMSIAVPVRDGEGKVVAAVNVSGQIGRNTRQDMMIRVLPALKRAAEEIGCLAGWNQSKTIA